MATQEAPLSQPPCGLGLLALLKIFSAVRLLWGCLWCVSELGLTDPGKKKK